MNRTQAMQSFVVARERMALAWDQAEALAILQELEDKIRAFIWPHRISTKGNPPQEAGPPVVVTSTTRWG